MKKIIFAIVTYFLFASVAQSQQVFKSDEHKFQLTFPDDCRLYENFQNAAVIAAYFDTHSSINVVVKEYEKLKNVPDGEYKFEGMMDSVNTLYSQTFKNFQMHRHGYDVKAGMLFYIIEYQAELNDRVLMVSQYFTNKGSKMYVISTGCFEEDSEKYKPLFDACVNTFLFIE